MSGARLAIPLPVVERQRAASDPTRSAWVSANAGSGKTHVLTQRVLRLLYAGAAPSAILCLTFTKTAAANMAAKVFETLASWTGLDDAALAGKIVGLGAPAPGPPELAFARRLFARAIETPGGLKIQTIHAFCERLLHLFPFEANVAAGFRVADDREAGLLLDQAARSAAFADAFATRRARRRSPASRATPAATAFDELIGEVGRGVQRRWRRSATRQATKGRCGAPSALALRDTMETIARQIIALH